VTDDKGFITVKGRGLGVRPEFKYEIPAADANQMLRTICIQPIIEKTRYKTEVGGFVFEVDEFDGENAGLVVAEIELDSEQQDFPRPDWLGADVTEDTRYTNASLIRRPYRSW